jgi:hypothetical protein
MRARLVGARLFCLTLKSMVIKSNMENGVVASYDRLAELLTSSGAEEMKKGGTK